MTPISSMQLKNGRNRPLSRAIPFLAFSLVCLFVNGCATTTDRNLTEDQLQGLKKTQTVLITADGVKGEQLDFFVGLFNSRLLLNAATPVTKEEKGEPSSNYDAVISLKCHCFDDKLYALWGPADQPIPEIGGRTSATGWGKRLGCRVKIVHKQLGQLFDGQIGGRTPERINLGPADAAKVCSTPDGYSLYLEERARLNFKHNLEKSHAWYLVKSMGPNS